MARFIVFEITNTSSPLAEGIQLVNIEHIESVSYASGTGIVTIILRGIVGLAAGHADGATVPVDTIGGRKITTTVTTTTDGSAGVPTFTETKATTLDYASSTPDQAIYTTMRGYESVVELGVDQAAVQKQMYFQDWAIASDNTL